jgi:hypothetical protein
MWLDPPVISRDGGTLNIVRAAHWDAAEWALCAALGAWLVGWTLIGYPAALLNISEPIIGRPDAGGVLVWLLGGLMVAAFLLRLISFGGETVSVGSRELRISRKWAGRWRTHRYPRPAAADVVTMTRQIKGGHRHWVGFDYQGKRIWTHATNEEFEVHMMLESLQEHLNARQKVQ